jgi:hypothetical protein
MTSTAKLIAIIVVWAASASIIFAVNGASLNNFMPASLLAVVVIGVVAAAAAATLFIARAAGSGSKRGD